MSIINSKVAICNLALNHLGVGEITTIETPDTEVAKTCANFYDITKETLLRDYNFQFSIKRASLPALAEVPEFGYSKQANLPSDFLTLIYLYNGNSFVINDGEYYRIEGNKILTDLEAPYNILYVANIQDVNNFTEEFKLLFSYYLAYLIGVKIGASSDKIQKVGQDFQVLQQKVRVHNGNDYLPYRINKSKYQDTFVNIAGTINNQVVF